MDVQTLIKANEGFSPTVYEDQFGNKTIGYGHELSAHPLDPDLYEPDGSLSEATAQEVFEDDLAAATAPLVTNLPWFPALDTVRQAVLQDMSFQLGWKGLSAFVTFLGLMQSGDYAGAAEDLLKNTALAKQVPKREAQNAQMLVSGCWPVQ
jgi:lysozyme